MKSSVLKIIILVTASLGLILSLYLAYEYAQPEAISCPISGDENSCETVRQSDYSTLLGIQLPYLGALFYTTFLIAFFVYILRYENSILFKKFLLLLVIGAFIFEGYYTFLQLFIIDAICTWCVIVELLTIILTISFSSFYLTTRQKRMD